ncbi:MAG: DUF3848 domain-containing protein, partial [Oscillospiraceae bacterium]|nr:DUF3848 domain-containing protein [Oscillospiraceae bacterium]
ADYRAELLLKDRQELIDGADRIAKTAEVFQYFTQHPLTEPEATYFLNFQNPLEVAVDHWESCHFELDALGAVIADTVDKGDDLALYPLAADAPERKPDGLQKFLNVDLETVLPQIRAQKTAFYQNDLNYALDTMREGAATEDPAKRNFVLIFRQSGVECLNERDMMIAGTRSYNTCQYYHRMTREPVLAYSVELIGDGTHSLRGNLYQRDQHQMAKFAERASSPYTDVTVTFFGGRQVRVPEKEYNFETIPSLKYHYGDIMDTRHEADDESVVQGALRREHERRERMPKGHIAVHVQALEESRIQAEADRLVSELQSLTEPNTPDKTHFMAEISLYFLPLASQDDMFRLFEKVQEQVKQPMYIAQVDGKRGQYLFMRREERAQEQKPSIKGQLAAKPAPSGQQAKPKEREAR